MPLNLTSDCTFTGPALPEPFVKFNLEAELNRLDLLPKTTGEEGRRLGEHWQFVRRKLRDLVSHGGGLRVQNHVIEPLLTQLGYARIEPAEDVQTREGPEAGGALLFTADGSARLRVWCVDLDADLDAPARRGFAYRFSHQRIAQRVLLAAGDRLGLLTNGVEVRLLISDPARVDSQVAIAIDPHWKRSRDLPDSVRLLIALASPRGVKALPELIDKARLQQVKVTKSLREQARHAVREFIQEILDHPENRSILLPNSDLPSPNSDLAKALWHEGLVTIYRLLFILKLESTDDPARSFSFASTSLWRNTFSPSVALAPIVRRVLDHGAQTGTLLQDGLRTLFRMFADGLQCTELNVRPMAGALFAPASTPILGQLHGTETAVARLLDNLLWTRSGRGTAARERVHYGPLDVEDLGRVYEALLELEPGISAETMCRLRRAKLEVVVPVAQGERYRPMSNAEYGVGNEGSLAPVPAPSSPSPPSEGGEGGGEVGEPVEETVELEEEADSGRGKKTKVEWIEEIPAGRFYLRVGLGRKATGSFYTPHSFVRFLVRETLGPLVARCVCPLVAATRQSAANPPSTTATTIKLAEAPTVLMAAPPSPPSEGGEGRGEVGALPYSAIPPDPSAILRLKVIDKAMGSGHFLVETCRFLGEALYEACRRCDELAAIAEKLAESYRKSGHADQATEQEARVAALRQRVLDLPDPDDELLRYLPSRSVEGAASGVSHNKAMALCRRMVAVHCLYGVDKNPLAVELAKLALWIECHAEGLPLTFLDHRLVAGDSLTGPFFEHLLKYPGSQQPLDDLFTQGLTAKLTAALADALQHVRALEATVGVTVADIEAKQAAKTRLDRALAPFKILAAAWSGGVMLGPEGCDDTAYAALAKHIAEGRELFGVPPSGGGAWGVSRALESSHASPAEAGTPNRPLSPPSEGGKGRGSPRRSEAEAGGLGIPQSEKLCRMIAKGLGLPTSPADWPSLQSAIHDPQSGMIPALPFDLAFPEVFYREADPSNRVGFDADLGNPPWERMEVDPEDYFGGIDFSVLERTPQQRAKIIERLKRILEVDAGWNRVEEQREAEFRVTDQLYEHQQAEVDGRLTLGRPDTYRLFVERAVQTTKRTGRVGWLVPSSFHSVEGATGVRRLYLAGTAIECCFSFENRRRLFEIDGRQKFDLVVASIDQSGTKEFPAAFYLLDDGWLFAHDRNGRRVTLSPALIQLTGGPHLTFVEAKSQSDFDLICAQMSSRQTDWNGFLESAGIVTAFGVELHRNPEFNQALQPPALADSLFNHQAQSGWSRFPIHAGKTMHQFTDCWETCTTFVAATDAARSRHWGRSLPHFRFALRMKARSNDERTLISAILTPGFVCEQTLTVETTPQERPSCGILLTCAVANSYPFDWQVRQRVTTSLSNYILAPIPLPTFADRKAFLAHSALRLSCNHAGYAPLWREQLGEAWREAGKPFTWPVLSGDEIRWAVRAAIDALVAQAYGLTRDQYAHVLSTFSHSSYKDAPRRCLAAFDELQSRGLETFTKKHDPYWDIPLNENLPKPVIDLPTDAKAEGRRQEAECRERSQTELFAGQIQTAPADGSMLLAGQPAATTKKTRKTN